MRVPGPVVNAEPPLVLHVIHHLLIGGMENGLVNLVNHMPASRYRHAIACIEDYSDFRHRIQLPEVEVIALRRNTVGVWATRRAMYALCRRLRPAIVHSRNQSGLDALPPARLAGVPRLVHGEHGWDVDNLHGRRWKPLLLRRLHSPLVDRYVAVSKDIERYLVQTVGIAPRRIEQIYNGVDVRRFAPKAVVAAQWPTSSARPDAIVIGTVGRLQRVKDQTMLLRAFATVSQQRPDLRPRLRLLIVGDGPLSGELKQLSHTLGIAPVTWFTGAVVDVAPLLRLTDIFALPSLNEGISNTVLEAMASGVPVLASAVGGNSELVFDGVNGALFAAGDVDALAARLTQYAGSQALRVRIGANARQLVEQRFSLQMMTERYTALYDWLLKRAT